MAGAAGAILQAERGLAVPPSPRVHDTFAERFAAESATSGAQRHLHEVQCRAQRLFTLEDWDGALAAFEEAATAAQDLQDRTAEAVAVLGLAECLSKPQQVDLELVGGMYSYAQARARETGDLSVEFSAIVGHARLVSVLRGSDQAALGLWEEALALSRSMEQQEQTAFVLTQLGILLLRDPDLSGAEVVNANKELEGRAGEGGAVVHKRVSASATRALKALAEAESLTAGGSASQRATAKLNLAQARLAQGTSPQRRAAAQDIAAALALREEAGDREALQRCALVLLELYEDHPWLVDSPEAQARLELCRAHAASMTGQQLVGAPSTEERTAAERMLWARQKQLAMDAQDSDSDDDAGFARPKFADWER